MKSQLIAGKLRFFIYSLIGLSMFVVPVYWNNEWTIGIGILAETLKSVLVGKSLPTIATCIVVFSALSSLLFLFYKPAWLSKNKTILTIFCPSIFWLVLRVIGAIFITLIYFNIGPEWIISKNTGGTILFSLNPVLIPFFFFAILFLPFLVDYGLMEFVGVLLAKPFQKIFKLPGRSCIDATASWLGSAPVGVLITAQQYEKGFYNQRESATIATNFSIASIAFSLLVVKFIGIPHLFLQFYAVVVITGIILALIMPRIPPLSLKKDKYFIDTGKSHPEEIPRGKKRFQWAYAQAIEKAEKAPSLPQSLLSSFLVLCDVYLGLMPVVFALGTIALALTEYTPIFTYLSYPFIWYLDLLQVPESTSAAPAVLVGFADMFLPSVIGHNIDNEMTKFVIACLSMTQIIYMTEVGALILKSKIPLNFGELVIIFLIRTMISLPIISLCAHLFIA